MIKKTKRLTPRELREMRFPQVRQTAAGKRKYRELAAEWCDQVRGGREERRGPAGGRGTKA